MTPTVAPGSSWSASGWRTPERRRVACSALRRSYRDLLRRHCPQVRFVHLSGTPELIARRASGRHGHFMPPVLVQSQFDALEPLAADENGITLDVDHPVEQLVGQLRRAMSSAFDHLGSTGELVVTALFAWAVLDGDRDVDVRDECQQPTDIRDDGDQREQITDR